MVANPNVRQIPQQDRTQFEGMGEEAVRQFCSANVWPRAPNGYPNATEVSARIWLAEKDQERQAKQARITKSTLIAAWIAAIGTIVSIILMFALWDHPRH
jgi:hypothetical protein